MRVIIPVFLPHSEGYFRDGLDILEVLLDSLVESMDERVRVSVIDNASEARVRQRLEQRLSEGSIDRVVHNQVNRGKVDAVLSELRAMFEPVAVVVDADVVFRRGWVDSVLAALDAFPECGMLGLSPSPGWHASTSVLSSARSTGARLLTTSVADADDMQRFAASIGRDSLRAPVRGHHLAVERAGRALVVGFGHFAFAVRREVVGDLPAIPSRSARGGTDAAFFETPADAAGWWCLSLARAAVHHIGNTIEDAERRTIAEFRSTELADDASPLRPPRRARAATTVPRRGRRAIQKVVRWSCERGAASNWIAPRAELRLAGASAVRLEVAAPMPPPRP